MQKTVDGPSRQSRLSRFIQICIYEISYLFSFVQKQFDLLNFMDFLFCWKEKKGYSTYKIKFDDKTDSRRAKRQKMGFANQHPALITDKTNETKKMCITF